MNRYRELTLLMVAVLTVAIRPRYLLVDTIVNFDRRILLTNLTSLSNLTSFIDKFLAVLIPEENRSINLLELSEYEELQKFHEQTLKLYCAMSALGNHRVAHALCRYIVRYIDKGRQTLVWEN